MAARSPLETDIAEKMRFARAEFPIFAAGANCIEQRFTGNIEMYATSTAYQKIP